MSRSAYLLLSSVYSCAPGICGEIANHARKIELVVLLLEQKEHFLIDKLE